MENTLHFKDYFIINIRAKDNPVDLPTKIDGLALLTDEEGFAIYGPKDEDIKKLVGTKFLPALRKIELDNVLLNINVVIWAGHTAAYLSYCDEIMTLPFQNPFNSAANDKFRKDFYDVSLPLLTKKTEQTLQIRDYMTICKLRSREVK